MSVGFEIEIVTNRNREKKINRFVDLESILGTHHGHKNSGPEIFDAFHSNYSF